MAVKRARHFWKYVIETYSDPETNKLEITDDKNRIIERYCNDTYFEMEFIKELFDTEFVPNLRSANLTPEQVKIVKSALKIRVKVERKFPVSQSLEVKMWEFVADSCRSCKKGNADASRSFLNWENFRTTLDVPETAEYYSQKFATELLPNIDTSPITNAKKMDIHMAFGIIMNSQLLKRIKSNFSVEIDSAGLLVNYQKRIYRGDENKLRRQSFSEAEDLELWQFLKTKIWDPKTKELRRIEPTIKVWNTYKQLTNIDRKSDIIDKRFHTILRNKLHLTSFETREKLELHWSLSIEVSQEALEVYERTHYVKLDDDQCVVEFWDKTSAENMETDGIETEIVVETPSQTSLKSEKRKHDDDFPCDVSEDKKAKLTTETISGTSCLQFLKKLLISLPNGKYEECLRLVDGKLDSLLIEDKNVPISSLRLAVEKFSV